MERIYEFLSENDLGYRVYIGSDNSIYMSYEDAIEYLEGKEVEVDYVEPDNSAVQIIVNDKEVCMVALQGVNNMFEDEYIIFFDYDEFDTLACNNFMRLYEIPIIKVEFDEDEKTVSVIIGNETIDQEFFIDLMEAVDSPLIVTDRYCGSSSTIRSLGLDDWVRY